MSRLNSNAFDLDPMYLMTMMKAILLLMSKSKMIQSHGGQQSNRTLSHKKTAGSTIVCGLAV